jgi:hypothetical protein
VNLLQLNLSNTNLSNYVDNKYLNFIQSTTQINSLGVNELPPPGYEPITKTFNILENVNMNNKLIKNLLTPVQYFDAATKGYCDDRIITSSNLTNYSISLTKIIGMDGDGT